MSDKDSKPEEQNAQAFAEHDNAKTRMTYGSGKWTWYIIVLWLTVMAGLVTYAISFVIPSLRLWGAP